MITDKKSIIQKMCEKMQRMRYAYKTENGYCDWVSVLLNFLKCKISKSYLKILKIKLRVF
jgi:hypothetical protein